jgi:hypothetical protein
MLTDRLLERQHRDDLMQARAGSDRSSAPLDGQMEVDAGEVLAGRPVTAANVDG